MLSVSYKALSTFYSHGLLPSPYQPHEIGTFQSFCNFKEILSRKIKTNIFRVLFCLCKNCIWAQCLQDTRPPHGPITASERRPGLGSGLPQGEVYTTAAASPCPEQSNHLRHGLPSNREAPLHQKISLLICLMCLTFVFSAIIG